MVNTLASILLKKNDQLNQARAELLDAHRRSKDEVREIRECAPSRPDLSRARPQSTPANAHACPAPPRLASSIG